MSARNEDASFQRIMWAVAVAGIRVANAFGFILLVAFAGAALGAIEGHPALAVWLVLPVVAVLVFENLWITGVVKERRVARLGGVGSLAVVGVVAWQLSTVAGNGFTLAVFLVLGFLALMAVTAASFSSVEGFPR